MGSRKVVQVKGITVQRITHLTPEILVPRLGEYLVEQGYLTAQSVERALQKQKEIRLAQNDAPLLGELLIEMGLLSRQQLDQAITEYIIELRSALESSNQQLEQRVKERTAELELALTKLSELNQLKNNFIANISHELRTPLTHIKGYEELFISGEIGDLVPAQTNAMRTMIKATERLERLIEDLILFATAERAQLQLNVASFDLEEVAQSIYDQMRPNADERNISMQILIPQTVASVRGDQEKIAWVTHQFLDNAIKFTAPGGKVSLEISEDDLHVFLTVTDTGIGIPTNRIAELFEPFHQLDGSSTRRFGGTGLGLSLAKKIIDAHGARINVISELGCGSSFSFWLAKDDDFDFGAEI
jgi:two-component system sensor histidine kinase/response regulator